MDLIHVCAIILQTGDMTEDEDDDDEVPGPREFEVPVTKEAFVSDANVADAAADNEEKLDRHHQRHVYDGYELLLDIDESVSDEFLPPASGKLYHSNHFFTYLFIF